MLKVLEGGKAGKAKNAQKDVAPAGAQAAVSAITAAAVLPMGLDELAREGARVMIAHALRIEAEDYVQRHSGEREPGGGRALVVRNGTARPRTVTLGSGTVAVKMPRVNDKRVIDGERQRFTSRILPPYARRSPKVEAVLPVLYLRGLSTGDFRPALRDLLGEDASGPVAVGDHPVDGRLATGVPGLAAAVVGGSRLRVCLGRRRAFQYPSRGGSSGGAGRRRRAPRRDEGGRRDRGRLPRKRGFLGGGAPWAQEARHASAGAGRRRRGAGASGNAKRQVWPETHEQRCWFHKLGNVLDKLPKRLQADAKSLLREIMNAPSRKAAEEGVARFSVEYASHKAAVTCLTDDTEELLAFFAFPADHWETPAHDESHRIDVLDDETPYSRDEGGGLPRGGPGHDVQAAPRGAGDLASHRRSRVRPPRSRRRALRRR